MSRILIVGAGAIGLFCALRLAKAGAKVVLLEAEPEDFTVHAPTASLAAAGMLAPIGEAAGDANVNRLALASFDSWRAMSKGALWEDGVRFGGGVIVAADADAVRERAMGRSVIPLSAGQWRKRSGLEARVENALFVEDEGVADPIRVLSGLAMDARRHGVQILFSHDVASVSAHSATTYEGAVFEADAVLLAPGVWATDQLIAAAPALGHVRPAKGHLVAVTLARPLGPNIRTPGFYLTRRMDDDVVLGASMEFGRYDRQVRPERVAALLAAAESLFPGEVRPRGQAWAGVRPMSPDGAPLIGRSGEVWIAAGHSRNGWLLAPITAEIICAQLMGGEISPLWKCFSPDRFDP